MTERRWSDDEQLSHDLDVLVDGELNETERRQLITQLESLPDGWRRCALAFLEHQCWRETMPELFSAPARPVSESGTALNTTAPARSASRLGAFTWFAMAASLLLAFGLGMAIRGSLGAREVASQVNGSTLAATQANPVTSVEAEAPNAAPKANGVAGAEPDAVDGQSTSEIWLPATSSEDGTAETELTAVLPNDLVRQLEESGHQLEQKQELWPVELKDGRRAILPVDRLDVRYVGDGYQ